MIRKKKWIQAFQVKGHLEVTKGVDRDKSEARRGPYIPGQNKLGSLVGFYKELVWEPDVPKQYPGSMLPVVSGGLKLTFFICKTKQPFHPDTATQLQTDPKILKNAGALI